MNNRRHFLVKSASALTMTFIVPSLLSSNAQAKKPLDQKVTDKKSWGMHIDVDKCVDGCGGQWCLADRIPVVPNATNQTNATNCTETILNEDKNLKKYNDDDTFTTCLLPRLQLYSITFEMLAG